MSYMDKLDQWFEAERAAGRILDIRFVAGSNSYTTLESAAKVVVESLSSEDEIDITKDRL